MALSRYIQNTDMTNNLICKYIDCIKSKLINNK